MKKAKIPEILFSVSAALFILLIMIKPDVCTSGAAEGLLLAGRVIIPSLFPFTACVLFIQKSGALTFFRFAGPFTKKVFHLAPELFPLMLLSFIGGYPIGAKLLNEAVKSGKLTPENAGVMLNYCVNAGPAFVIIAVGGGIIGSRSAGCILLAAHILSSVILSIFFGFFIRPESPAMQKNAPCSGAADNFVSSVSEAASAVFSICAYVVFFSTVTAYIQYYTPEFPPLKAVGCLLEITNAVSGVRNIIAVAFLLGFAGICIWCQILSVGRLIQINFPVFALSRIVQGILSSAICALLLKIFGISVSVSAKITFSPTYSGIALSLSMLCMVIILIISLFTKKRTGNILEDIV